MSRLCEKILSLRLICRWKVKKLLTPVNFLSLLLEGVFHKNDFINKACLSLW